MLNMKSRLVVQAVAVLGLLGVAGTTSAQSWVDQSRMKVARVEATTVDYRDSIYVFNGFKPGIVIANSVERYDVATKQWSIISNTSTSDGSAVTHNGVIRSGADVWIIGGRIGSHPGRVSDKVWIYNLDTGNWRRGPDLPTPGAAGGAALVNNKVHWFGGIDANARCDVGNHFVYDLNSPSSGWKNISASAGMPSPRNHFSTAVVDGIIYAMGGQYGHDGCPGKFTQDTDLVHAFNPNTNKWSQKADMPNVNSHSEPGTFVYKGDIYTTGGENAKNKVWKYSPQSNKWSTFRTMPVDLVAPIARIVDGRLIVAGGGGPIAQLATNKVFSMLVDNNPPALTTTPTPQPEPEPPTPVPGSNTPEGDTLISMEAEYFDISTKTSTHQWVHVAHGNSSNDDAMITTPDEGQLAESTDNTPMLSYMVYFNYPGKHYIWVRGLGDTNASGVGNNDSIQVGLNGIVATTAYRIDQFPAEWTWSRHTPSNPVATLNVVNAGVNMVNLWMREDGLAIDKFVITSDPNFVPSGMGPALTDGSDGYVAPISSVSNTQPIDDDPSVAAPTNDTSVESEPVNDGPVVSETVNENPVVSVPVSIDPVVAKPVNDGPFVLISVDDPAVGSDSTDNAVTGNNLSSAVDPTAAKDGAGNGLFGGSTSLFALLILCLVSVRRYKTLERT